MERVRIGNVFSVACGALLLLSAGVASAQSPSAATSSQPAVASNAAASTRADVEQFVSTYGTPVVESSTPAPAAQIDSAPPTPRLRALQKLADDSNVTWQKVYKVSPAGVGEPVTTVADATSMVDQTGDVSLSGTQIPAATAIKAVAAADDAKAEFTDGALNDPVAIDLSDATLPDAIAALADRTHTHWQAEYVLAPIAGQSAAEGHLAIAAPPVRSYQNFEATQLFNGPLTVHVAPMPTPAQIAAADKAAAAAEAKEAAATAAAEKANAANNPANANNPAYDNGYNASGGDIINHGYAYSNGYPYRTTTVSPYGGSYVINGSQTNTF